MSNQVQRKADTIREILIPVIVAVLVGAASSYVSVKVTLSVFEQKIIFLENEVNDLNADYKSSVETRIELAARREWMNGINKSIELLISNQQEIRALMDDRYRRKEALAINDAQDERFSRHIEKYHNN